MTVQAPFGFMVGNAHGILPNEGVPLSRLLIAPPEPPPPPPPQQYGPAPEAPNRWTAEETQIALGQLAILLRQIANHLPIAQQQAAAAAAPAPSATATTTDPLAFWRNDIGYFFPEIQVDVHFLASGLRPCDGIGMWSQTFEYQILKLPVNMTVAEMVTGDAGACGGEFYIFSPCGGFLCISVK